MYTHDCDVCRLLTTVRHGSHPHNDDAVDWYVCGDTLIGRYGNAGHMYWSALISMVVNMEVEGYVGTKMCQRAMQIVKRFKLDHPCKISGRIS